MTKEEFVEYYKSLPRKERRKFQKMKHSKAVKEIYALKNIIDRNQNKK